MKHLLFFFMAFSCLNALAKDPVLKKDIQTIAGYENSNANSLENAIHAGSVWAAQATREGNEGREYCGVVCENTAGAVPRFFLQGLNKGKTKKEIEAELNANRRGPRGPRNRKKRSTKAGQCSFAGLSCPNGSHIISFFHSHPNGAKFSPADKQFINHLREKYMKSNPDLARRLRLGLGVARSESDVKKGAEEFMSQIYPPYSSDDRMKENQDSGTSH